MVNEAVMNGVQREFETIRDTKLVKNIVQVILHGLLADEKLFADFFVAETLRDKLNNFLFAVAE